MKKFAVMFVMAMLLPLTACAQEPASKWKEGTHYTVLDKEATDKPVITGLSVASLSSTVQ